MAEPDGALRVRADKPAKPVLKTPNDTAKIIADLYAWGESLEGNLKAIWQSIDAAKADAEKLNKGKQP